MIGNVLNIALRLCIVAFLLIASVNAKNVEESEDELPLLSEDHLVGYRYMILIENYDFVSCYDKMEAWLGEIAVWGAVQEGGKAFEPKREEIEKDNILSPDGVRDRLLRGFEADVVRELATCEACVNDGCTSRLAYNTCCQGCPDIAICGGGFIYETACPEQRRLGSAGKSVKYDKDYSKKISKGIQQRLENYVKKVKGYDLDDDKHKCLNKDGITVHFDAFTDVVKN